MTANKMDRENLQSASALYVPLIRYPFQTVAEEPTSGGLRPSESAACGCNKSIATRHFAAFHSNTFIAYDLRRRMLRNAELCCGVLNGDAR
jgi:hypothetical protein